MALQDESFVVSDIIYCAINIHDFTVSHRISMRVMTVFEFNADIWLIKGSVLL